MPQLRAGQLSIAVTGCLSPDFVPLQLPILDDHPSLARDAYGNSKALMEGLVHYFARVHPDAAFTLLRFGAVVDEAKFEAPNTLAGSPLHIPFAEMALVGCSDVLHAIELAYDAPSPGVRTFNVVAPDATGADAPRTVLEAHFGDRLNHIDWSHYERSGHEHDALYAMDKIRDELGFVPRFSTRRAQSARLD